MMNASVPRPTASKGQVQNLLRDIAVQGQQYDRDEDGSRERLLQTAKTLVQSLESPLETILGLIWSEPTRIVAARVALDLQLFETLLQDGGRPKDVNELAATTGASPKLVQRIARKLATMNLIGEAGMSQYAPNHMTEILAIPKYRDGIRFCFDCGCLSLAKLPQFLENTNYQNPEDAANGAFQFSHENKPPFEWLNERPRLFEAFQNYLHGQREDRPTWTDSGFYPVHERLVEGLRPDGDASVLVDVGGGAGHVLSDFLTDVPEWKGRVVLQEQETTINLVRGSGLNPRIEPMVHNFFTPQPIKGARAYYMRYILHDWTDEDCRKILGQLKDAMEPGYSKILINEYVMADRNPSWQHTSLDLIMMALASSHERSELEWRGLIESCGLKITGIWSKGEANESLIEVTL